MTGPTASQTSQARQAGRTDARAGPQASRQRAGGPHGDVLALQRAAGNLAVGRLLHAVREQQEREVAPTQAPDGPLERDADRAADDVTVDAAASRVGRARPPIQRLPAAASGRSDPAAAAGVARALDDAGQPLDRAVRADMESRLGHDLSQVRTHTGPAAERSARALGADAYTVGRDVVFGAGRFAPAMPEGRRLLAHELAHVVQQLGRDPRGSARPALQMKRDATRQGARAGRRRTIVAIHVAEGATGPASAFVLGETKPVSIEVRENELAEGSYTYVKRDAADTAFVEFVREDGGKAGFRWFVAAEVGVVVAERVTVDVGPGEFSMEAFAKSEFDAVPDRIRKQFQRRGARELKTPEEMLGFANFARRLQERGVTDEELALFRARNRGAADPRRPFDWANDWQGAVDEVIGARAELERKADENTELFRTWSSTIPNVSDETYALYAASRFMPQFRDDAARALAESGVDIDELEANQELLMEQFDERLRLETAAALDRFQGSLLLTRERFVEDRGAKLKILEMRAAARDPAVLALKATKEQRDRDRDAAEERYYRTLVGHGYIPATEQVKDAKKAYEAADAVAVEARVAFLTALQKASGIPVATWRGLDVGAFFYGPSESRSLALLTAFIDRSLRDVERARRELGKDKGTIYKADMMVRVTKQVLGIESGSTVEKLLDAKIEEARSAPLWERLLDVLSLALIFIPGGAVITAVRLGVGVAQTVMAIDNEALAETLARAEVRTEGGSAGSVALNVVGSVADVGDLAKLLKGGAAILDKGADVERALTRMADAAAPAGSAGAKAESVVEEGAEGAGREAGVVSAPGATPDVGPPAGGRAGSPEPDVPQPPVVRADAPAATPAPVAAEAPPRPVEPEASAPPHAVGEPVLHPLPPEHHFGDVGPDLRVPEATGPVVGQKMGRATPDTAPKPPARTFTDDELRAMDRAERRLFEQKKREVLDDLKQRRPEVYREVIKRGRLQSGGTISDWAVSNPDRAEFLYGEWVRGRARAKDPIKSSFAGYVKKILSHDRGLAGEARDAFVRSADEILVKAPKEKATVRGSDSMSYHTDTDRIKYLDNKSVKTGTKIREVSALEKNLIHNLKEDIADIERWAGAAKIPPEIQSKVLPRLKDALAELEEYVAKHPPGDAYAADVRDAFDSILRNNGIDRVVTFAGAGPGARAGGALSGTAGFKTE